MLRSNYVGSDRNVQARIAEQQKADATAAYLKETRTRQQEATWVSKSGQVLERVIQREKCVPASRCHAQRRRSCRVLAAHAAF